MATDKRTLEELERLEKAATPLPWYAGSHSLLTNEDGDCAEVEFCEHPELDTIDSARDGMGKTVVSTGGGEYSHEPIDLRLAVAARNALPSLLADARRLAEVEASFQAQRSEIGKLEDVCVQWHDEVERLRARVAELEKPQ